MRGTSRPAVDPARRHSLRVVAAGMLLATSGRPSRAQPGHEALPWLGPTPGLRLPDLDGRTWDLAAHRGQVVLLNFWASWCEPCRAEMPSLEHLARRHEADGLAVVAVNFKERAAQVKHFLAQVPLALPMLLDADGAAARAWQARILPSTVLIDRRGRARRLVRGELDWTGPAAAALVAPLLSEARPARP
jgi:thiol-disulfide isomerase/thioredoxin